MAAGCGPKGRPGGSVSSGGTVTSGGSTGGSVSSNSDTSDIRTTLGFALGAGRLTWNDPAVRPGERLRWRVSPTTPPDMVIEMKRSEPSGLWLIAFGPPGAMIRTIEAQLAPDGARLTSLSWSAKGKPTVEAKPETLDAIFPAAHPVDEAAFVAAGGRFLGNEVVKVPAGEFRARHAVVEQGGALWHFYVTRAVPGGVVKIEVFDPGANDPSLSFALEDFTRLPKAAPTPNPTPMATATPPPPPAP